MSLGNFTYTMKYVLCLSKMNSCLVPTIWQCFPIELFLLIVFPNITFLSAVFRFYFLNTELSENVSINLRFVNYASYAVRVIIVLYTAKKVVRNSVKGEK